MPRSTIAVGIAALLICLGAPSVAGAASPIQLVLDQSAAFSVLGHSCGGIQERVYATGFAPNGYPTGEVYMQTSCGGSGRGGGYKTTTYSAWATVTWDWHGATRAFSKLEGAADVNPTFSAEDAHGDRVYNLEARAFLEADAPPVQAPLAPTGVTAEAGSVETGEEEEPTLRFTVGWMPAAETAGLITSSTVTATPVGSSAPVLATIVSGPGASAVIEPLQPHTTYRITVTNTDDEGSSEASAPIEASSSGSVVAPGADTCEQDSGTIKLSPGLTETPHVQAITINGRLKGCDGPAEPAEASYVAHLTTTKEVTCSTLSSLSSEPGMTSVSLVVKWAPKSAGVSDGTLLVPLTEAGGSLEGVLEGGPFPQPQSIFAASLAERFTGGPACGVAPAKGKAKPVKSGTFTTSALEIG